MLYRALLCSLLLATSAAWGAEEIIWQIGKPDHDYAEFACAGDYHAMGKRFHRPIVFEPGRSEPARDWPFIQPGPMDVWSGLRGRPWTIRFELPGEPRGVFRLRIEFVDVQAITPPRYSVAIGQRMAQFQLEPGRGDFSLTNAKLGRPQKIELTMPADFLTKGRNEIQLACTEGSWVQYDAVTLLGDPDGKLPTPEVQSIAAKGTPYFVRSGDKVCRVVDVTVGLTAPATGLSLKVEAAGQTSETPISETLLFGSVSREVGVPECPDPLEVKVTATVGQSSKTATATITPQRKWRIYVAPSSHTDIGYTHLQPLCAERHNQNTDMAVKLLRDFPDFRWNLEVAWQAENYLATRKGAVLDEFLQAARDGKIGVQALYCNILTGLCSHEQACRLTAYAHKLQREQKIPYRSAMISDVPTQEASLPMLLAGSGIRYFSSGINNDRAYTFTQLQSKCPCWWEGPDGSRVLMMYVHGYSHANGWGLDQSVETARTRVISNLRGYEQRKDYPFDAVFLHGAVSDNCLMNPKLADVCKAWNDRYEFPKVILSHNAEFFEYIDKQYGDKLPVFRGSAGTYWEDGAGSSARETTLCRNAHETVANAEKFLALADRIGGTRLSQPEAIYNVWRNCMLYDEHTWGASGSISQPEAEMTKAQWKIKAQFAVDADQGAKKLLEQGSRALASLVETAGPALVVFNPSSWTRTDVVQVRLPENLGVADTDVQVHQTPHGAVLLAKDVPACGYRTFKLGPRKEQAAPQSSQEPVLESRFYRIAFDPTSGAVTSIQDKEIGKELVDPKAPYKLNQYVYVAGGKGTRIVMNPGGPEPKLTITAPEKGKLRRLRQPGMGELMIVETSGTMAPKIISVVVVWDDLKRIDIGNVVTKTSTYEKEGVYFAFPFAPEKPTFRYEVPAGIVNANKDMLPGACLDWFTVQDFVEVEGRDATVAWATPDAPLACFQDVNRGKWRTKLPMENGHVYAYVMNNYWHTNYKAAQDGEHTFRFSITSRAKSDLSASARFGSAVSNPLVGVVVGVDSPRPVTGEGQGVRAVGPSTTLRRKLPASGASILSISEPNVLVIGVKQPDSGPGLVVRLWEVEGKATTAHVRLDKSLPAAKATACNLVEMPGEPLEVRDGTIAVPLRASGLATVVVE